jgi:hypothetical protein
VCLNRDLADTELETDLLIRVAHRSAHSKSGIERPKQSRIAKRLEQALHDTLFEQAWTDGLISLSSDEDDGDFMPAKR